MKPGGALKSYIIFGAAIAVLILLAAPTNAVALEALFPYANGDSEPSKTKKDVGSEKKLPLPAKTKDTGAEKKFSFPPFYVREKTAKRDLTQILWPLYAHEKTAAGEEYRQIINLYMSDRSVKRNADMKGVLWVGLWLAEWGHEGNLSKTAFRPFFCYERDEEDDYTEFDLLFPLWERFSLINYRRSKTESRFRIFPILWSRSGKKFAHLVGFPLFWYVRDSEKKITNTVIFPLYWHKADANRGYSRHIIPPLLTASTRDDSRDYYRLDALFPLFGYRREYNRSRAWLVPLFYLNSNARTSFAVGFPLFWHYAHSKGTRNEKGTTLLFPLAARGYRGSKPGDRYRRYWILPPLFTWVTDERDDRLGIQLLPPFGLMYNSNRKTTRAHYLILGWHRRYGATKEQEVTSSGFLPLYISYRDNKHKTAWWMATPLLWHLENEKESYTWAAPPLFMHYRDKKENNETYWAGLLYYQNKKRQSTLRVLFPLYWQRWLKDKREHYIAFPALLSGWYGEYDKAGKPQYERYFFTPFFHYAFDRRKEKNTRRFDAIYPLISYHSWKGGKHARFAPFFWYGKNHGGKDYLGFPPFYFQWRDNSESIRMISALAWEFSDKKKGTRYRTVFPILHDYVTKDRRVSALFPFVYYLRENETKRKSLIVFPLYLRDWSEDHTADISPLFFRIHDRKKNRLDWGIFPLVYDSIDKTANTRTSVAFPLYFYFRNAEDRTRVVGPGLYYRQTKGDHFSRLFVLGPIFHRTVDKKEKYWRTDVLFPLVKYERDGDYVDVRGFPFYWRSGTEKKGGEAIFPFFWRLWDTERKYKHYGIMPPLYLRTTCETEDYSRTDVIWPFASFCRSGKDSHSRIIPLWWHWRNGKRSVSSVAFPFYWNFGRNLDKPERRFKATAYFPVFARIERGKSYTANIALLNLLSWSSDPERGRGSLNVAWPLFRYRYSPHHTKMQFFPLFNYSRSTDAHGVPKRTNLGVLPLLWYMYRRSTNPVKPQEYRDLFILPPLFIERRNYHAPGADGGVLYPILLGYHTEPRRTYVWSFPLFVYWKNHLTSESNLFALPFVIGDISYRSRRYTWALPFWGRTVRGSHTRHAVFPALTSWYTYSDSKNHGGTFLWPLGWWKSTRSYGYLRFHPLFYYSRVKDERHIVALPPLFFAGENKAEGSGYRAFFPLYWDFFDKKKRTTHILPFFGYYRKTMATGNVWSAWVLGPVFWTARDEVMKAGEYNFLWPIARYAWCGDEEKECHVIPFFWYQKNKKTGYKTFYLFPYYSRIDARADVDIIFPLYWRWKWRKSGESTRIIFPLYWSSRDAEGNYRSYYFPFWGHGKFKYEGNLYDENMFIFPLLYNERSTELGYSSTWVVWPIFNTMTSPDRARSFLFPAFHYTRKGSGKDAELNFNLLGIVANYNREGFDTDFRILWEVIHKKTRNNGQDGSFHILWGLFGYEREAAAVRLRILWFFSLGIKD
ncbi:MAG: hypothetical protein E3J72_21720 [Planctomycetota bacterium]|nr:MAG: hypothetical protein E3J72_21720 [Planctomycetota bacterium]